VKTLFGLPVDKIAAFLIALFMLSFGLETLFNAVRFLLSTGTRGELVFFRTRSILGLLFQRKTREKFLGFVEARLGVRIRGSRGLRALRTGALVLLPLGLLGLYFSTCFTTLGPDEEGVLERFGEPVSREALGPGLVVKFPWPVDRVRRVEAKRIRRQTVGFKGDDVSPVLAWARTHAGLEAPFLSGDDKYVNSYIVIHYRICDVYDYLYGFVEADRALDDYAYRIYTGTLARSDFYALATDLREEGEAALAADIQEALDRVSSGLEVVSVNIKDLHPPLQVSPAFEAVVAAKQEKERYVNQALGQKTVTLAQAQETKLNRLAEARAWVWRTVNHAEGIAESFCKQLENHASTAPLTDLRLYLETVKEAFPKIRKIVVDPKTGRADLWLDLMDSPDNWGPRFEDEGPEEY